MKRFGLLLLLASLIASQSIWLAPEIAFAQDEVAATQTAEAALAASQQETETAAAQQTQAAIDAEQTAVSANQTAIAEQEAEVSAQLTAAASATNNAVQPAEETATYTATPIYKDILVGDWVKVNTASLNVRSTPAANGAKAGEVNRNQEFQVLEGPISADGYWWVRIDMGTPDTDPRWIAANYVLRIDGPTPPTLTPTVTSTPSSYKNIKPGDTVRVTASSVNVRSSGSTSGTIVAIVKRDAQYRVLDGPVLRNGYNWIRIDMGSTAGGQRWIAAEYVVVVPPAATATPSRTPTQTMTPTQTPTIDPSASATMTATLTYTPTQTTTPSGTVTAGDYRVGEKIVVKTSLNVRSGPSTSNGVLVVAQVYSQGTIVTGNTPGGSYTWVQVNFGATTGWVAT
ncbi:MAG: SH3 domain-containing protein, partial [Thermomicrobiales bacterium]|nr:SH3 domain-containing protein [Thermomicrobiales bacterium]